MPYFWSCKVMKLESCILHAVVDKPVIWIYTNKIWNLRHTLHQGAIVMTVDNECFSSLDNFFSSGYYRGNRQLGRDLNITFHSVSYLPTTGSLTLRSMYGVKDDLYWLNCECPSWIYYNSIFKLCDLHVMPIVWYRWNKRSIVWAKHIHFDLLVCKCSYCYYYMSCALLKAWYTILLFLYNFASALLNSYRLVFNILVFCYVWQPC